jgi:hypothetical protein
MRFELDRVKLYGQAPHDLAKRRAKGLLGREPERELGVSDFAVLRSASATHVAAAGKLRSDL